MLRILLAFALVLTLGAAVNAGCPGGNCPRPVRSLVSPRPTLAPQARKHTATPHQHSRAEQSIVVRRGFFHRGPGLWARITFRPGRR